MKKNKSKRRTPVRSRIFQICLRDLISRKRSTPALPLEFSKLSLSKAKRSTRARTRNNTNNYKNKLAPCKRSQEEMVGFALIIILVAVILLVFLAISLNKPKTEIESYEVNSFLQATLQYTTACQSSLGIKKFNDIQNLVFECELKNKCSDEKDTCKILNETLTGLLKESWQTGEDIPNKGYELIINTEEELILNIREGNLTKNCRGSSQDFSKTRPKRDFKINFEVCS